MAQNIYDDAQFFAGYSTLERFGSGWRRAMEHGDFLGLLPEVRGKRVLDLGCGAAQLAHFLAERGALEVVGVDVSERMLALAQPHPRLTLQRAAIEDVDFPAKRFDVVVSSLAFHYVADYTGLAKRIARWLVPGGALVFSTEHPIYTARLPSLGWTIGEAGERTGWAIDHYADEGARLEHWFVSGVRKYHRTISTLVNGLIDAGLRLDRLVEPVPSSEWLSERPADAEERRRPMFLLLRASRPD
jgi:2-polyprenyl-3-methyl-5-hydroxy-6-metoxy-1,4-benzoquinol methylase